MESLEKVVASLNGRKRPRISLSSVEQRKVLRLLSRLQSESQKKSIKLCRTLLDYGLLTSCVSSQLVDFFTRARSVDGLEALMDSVNDLPESCLVKILVFAIAIENGMKPPSLKSDQVPLILRLLRYQYSSPSLTQELKRLSLEQVSTMFRLLNRLYAQLLVSKTDCDRVPSLVQVVEFLNCLGDASTRFVQQNGSELVKDISHAATLVDCSVALVSLVEEAQLRRSKAALEDSSRRLKDYSIQVLTFNG